MSEQQPLSVESMQLLGQYEELRQALQDTRYSRHLSRPLACWVVPSDRRLPLAFLRRTVGEIVARSFNELMDTPGVGLKKMRSLVRLLHRVIGTDQAAVHNDEAAPPDCSAASTDPQTTNGFDPAAVSEIIWDQWRRTVCRLGLEQETLGRLAPTLRYMTRVIWHKPLAAYVPLSLREIRELRTHGEKRVRSILEVFHAVSRAVKNCELSDHLSLRLVPRRIDEVERWVDNCLIQSDLPTSDEILARFVRPLIAQLQIDAHPHLVQLAESRLGLNDSKTSVRQIARRLSLTRARVYQLLHEIGEIMAVRWPEGKVKTRQLLARWPKPSDTQPPCPARALLAAAFELFFPPEHIGQETENETEACVPSWQVNGVATTLASVEGAGSSRAHETGLSRAHEKIAPQEAELRMAEADH